MATVSAGKKSSRETRDHKYVKLRRLLDEYIEQGNVGDPLPSFSRMLSDLNVSQWVADRALQDLVAAGKIVRINGKGVFISERAKQKTVALVFGDHVDRVMSGPYPRILMNACREHALENNQRLVTFFGVPQSEAEADEDPNFHDLAKALRGKEIDGIFFGGFKKSSGQLTWLTSHGAPVVSSDALPSSRGSSAYVSFDVDWRELVRMGVDALARQSCRDIAFIGNYHHGDLRAKGANPDIAYFQEAMQEHGVVCNPEWIWDPREYISMGGRSMVSEAEAEGFQAMSELWRTLNAQGRRLDGVVVTDDFLTRGCLSAAFKLGLRLNEDFKIATHANKGSDALHRFEDDLSIMEVDASEMADAMIQTLTLMMRGKPYEAEQVFKPRLKLPFESPSRHEYRNAGQRTPA